MSTQVQPPLPRTLPGSAVPDGCLPWSGEQARRWTRALPPRWVPARVYGRHGELVTFALVGVSLALGLAGVEPYLAALLPLQVLWVVLRPELLRLAAPGLVTVAVLEEAGRPALVAAVLFAAVTLALAETRLWTRRRQRAAALTAAGDVTAPVPGAHLSLRRGVWLGTGGLLALAVGWAAAALGGVWAAPGFLLAGLGLTALASAALGRSRAARLRSRPAPVLRVLVRDDPAARTEVFAADDVDALRPLFIVSAMPLDLDEDEAEPGEADEADEGELDEDTAEALLDALDDDEPGPLREAVLYGAPYDGAEIVIVSADEDPDGPPVVERSSGPVRPLADRSASESPVAGEGVTAAPGHRMSGEGVTAAPGDRAAVQDVTIAPKAVLTWRAGWLDLLAALLLAQWAVWLGWGTFTDPGTPLWETALVVLVGVAGAARLPVKVGWRITADRTGLWINGLFSATHVPWDDFRLARAQSLELRLRWRGGGHWAVSAPRWKWLERRRGLTHPYVRTAARLTALRTDPELRPTAESDERGRGRALWPWALLLAAGWTAAVVVARAGM
ncbi:hypothetical protein [Streptomyces sp. NPDC000983]|uniref:hypothetical protein n=1 Tax=Streptomyces sp. NPDC000983 TaxID=3154373 RepID=UPI003319E431